MGKVPTSHFYLLSIQSRKWSIHRCLSTEYEQILLLFSNSPSEDLILGMRWMWRVQPQLWVRLDFWGGLMRTFRFPQIFPPVFQQSFKGTLLVPPFHKIWWQRGFGWFSGTCQLWKLRPSFKVFLWRPSLAEVLQIGLETLSQHSCIAPADKLTNPFCCLHIFTELRTFTAYLSGLFWYKIPPWLSILHHLYIITITGDSMKNYLFAYVAVFFFSCRYLAALTSFSSHVASTFSREKDGFCLILTAQSAKT